MKLYRIDLSKALFLSTAIFPSLTFAAAWQTWEQSAMGAGMAHADMAAGALDASTAYYNPAGMTRLDSPEMTFGGEYINENTHLTDMVYTSNMGVATSLPDTKSNFTRTIPNFHLVYPVKDVPFDPRFGLSVVTNGGGATYYKNTFLTSYAGTTAGKVLLINPSLAFQLTEKLSIGAGWDIQQFRTNYTISEVPPEDPSRALANGEVEMSDWANSWNAGLLYEFTEATRIGATFRSKVSFHQYGTAYVTFYEFGQNGVQVGESAFSDIEMPATTTFGIYHDMNERLSLMATAAYIQWDSIDNVALQVPVMPDITGGIFPALYPVNFDFKNTWFFSVGGQYALNKKLITRAGFSFDETPTNDEYREAHLPDADRYTFAVGLGYQLTEYTRIDGSYQFVYTPEVNFSDSAFAGKTPGSNEGDITGNAKSYANIIGLQLTWDFCCKRI